jgi:four helix bundle protein
VNIPHARHSFGIDEMPMMHTDLDVWKTAIDLAVEIYTTTERLPQEERYGLAAQMRRASSSISSNISEGAARDTRRDMRRFFLIARGSLKELETQVIICSRLRFLPASDISRVEALTAKTGQLLNGLIRRYRET